MEDQIITEEQVIEVYERCRREKGFPRVDLTEDELMNAANLLLCHQAEVTNLMDTVVGMKLFLERVKLHEVYHVAIYPGDCRPRFTKNAKGE